jgi:hypothetical protein
MEQRIERCDEWVTFTYFTPNAVVTNSLVETKAHNQFFPGLFTEFE